MTRGTAYGWWARLFGRKRGEEPGPDGWRILLAVLIALGAALVTLLWPQPRVSIQCDPPSAGAMSAEGKPLATTRYAIQNQIIVTGPASEVRRVASDVPELELQLLRTCNVRVRRPGGLDVRSLPFPSRAMRHLRMDLYGVGSETSMKDAVEKINKKGVGRYVADPNYLVGLLGQSACGTPHTVVGSPHTVVGSPHTVVGSPVQAPVGTGSWEAAETLFWDQWAWDHTGLGPSLAALAPLGSPVPTGEGVRIGILDTSPFTQTRPYSIEWMSPTWTLQVSLTAVPSLLPTIPVSESIRDHGLFVAGLVHAAAPESEIHLIQVLDDHGCGSLFDLNKQVYTFIAQVEEDRCHLDGAVLNLSMGVLRPRLPEGTHTEEVGEEVVMEVDLETTVLAQDTIESLQAAVGLAHSRGIVVVAAAGNDSYVGTQALSPHLPAAYPSAIGVAASNVRRERACFSNWGDVSAPGGDGGPNPGLQKTLESRLPAGRSVPGHCLPSADLCQGKCDDALISLGLTSETKYYYWSGTSFSTPLVSGLAALVLDPSTKPRSWLPVDDVFGAIRCGAPTGDGVINAPATLFRCLP